MYLAPKIRTDSPITNAALQEFLDARLPSQPRVCAQRMTSSNGRHLSNTIPEAMLQQIVTTALDTSLLVNPSGSYDSTVIAMLHYPTFICGQTNIYHGEVADICNSCLLWTYLFYDSFDSVFVFDAVPYRMTRNHPRNRV